MKFSLSYKYEKRNFLNNLIIYTLRGVVLKVSYESQRSVITRVFEVETPYIRL